MSRTEWESRFQSWSNGPGKTETERCDNAERIVKQCLVEAGILDKYQLEVFTQGSFANRTNIPQESDVDICVRSMAAFFGQYPEGLTKEDFGFSAASFTYAQLKNDVERALRVRFGGEMKRGDKCFSLRANTYRVDADVTAALEHRRYYSPQNRALYYSGSEFITDAGKPIINWPKQHINSGVSKHDATNQRFRKLVRILKRLQFDLIDSNALTAKLVPSYALECCAFNIANESLTADGNYYDTARRALALVYQATADESSCDQWVEVNQLKWLLRPSQPWKREDVHRFALLGYKHVGYS